MNGGGGAAPAPPEVPGPLPVTLLVLALSYAAVAQGAFYASQFRVLLVMLAVALAASLRGGRRRRALPSPFRGVAVVVFAALPAVTMLSAVMARRPLGAAPVLAMVSALASAATIARRAAAPERRLLVSAVAVAGILPSLPADLAPRPAAGALGLITGAAAALAVARRWSRSLPLPVVAGAAVVVAVAGLAVAGSRVALVDEDLSSGGLTLASPDRADGWAAAVRVFADRPAPARAKPPCRRLSVPVGRLSLPQACCLPGFGHGDDNHCHIGPPGQPDDPKKPKDPKKPGDPKHTGPPKTPGLPERPDLPKPPGRCGPARIDPPVIQATLRRFSSSMIRGSWRSRLRRRM